MNYDWQMHSRSSTPQAAAFLPPALVEETPWDILMTLHSKKGRKLSLGKLGSIVSAPDLVLNNWLALFEERQIITAERQGNTQEIWAVLTDAGRRLLDHYISVTRDLQNAPITPSSRGSAG